MSDSRKSQGLFGFIGELLGNFFGSILLVFLLVALFSGMDTSSFGGKGERKESGKSPWLLAMVSIMAVAAGFYWFSRPAAHDVPQIEVTAATVSVAAEAKSGAFCFKGKNGTVGRMIGMDSDTVVIRSGDGKLHSFRTSEADTVSC
nr:hypothetical protein [Neorhizobium tomejilense]